ncbi:MAG: serine hydrolase domain-containing protein, partial [Bacteroidota bacterium]
ASVSKLFTAQAIVQLAAEGRLSLDDKLVDWAPGLNYRDAAFTNITIRQLLNSTAGLSDVSNYRWGKNQQAETSLTDYVLSQNFRLESEPGTTYSYSNLGYNLLGYVIEQCTSTPFEDHLRSAVLEPAGMEQSDFRAFRIADSLRVAPHSRRGSKGSVYQRSIYPYTREHAASSTLNASATELSSWMLHFFQQLKDQTTAATFRAMISPSFAAYPQIGLGFQLYGFAEGQAIGHFGGDKGFRSLLMMIPEYEHGVVVLANCDYQEDFRQEIVLEIMGWLLVSSSTGIP